MRSILGTAALGFLFVLPLACSGSDAVDTSTDELGKKHYHYEPSVSDVTFNAGCGVIDPQNPPTDCTYGFEMTYVKDYADLKTTVSHTTHESTHTIDVTVDTWSYSQIHPMIMVGPQTYDLGMLGAKAGETYDVTIYDRKHVPLWSGKVATSYHM